MVAVRSHEADRLLARPPAHVFAFLFYGSDVGLVSERARKIIAMSIVDPHDPFQLVRLDGDDLAADPARLSDEANTVGLFGGKRALWIEAGSKNFAQALEPLFADPPPDCALVIEAQTLRRDAPLRRLFEREKTALAIECYPDRSEDIARLIDAEAAAAGLCIGAETRDILSSLLGADRLTTRSELAKLVLYVHGKSAIEEEDVAAIIADASALVLDAAINGAFSGDYAAVSDTAQRVFAAGGDSNAVLAASLRHALLLHRIKLDMEKGTGLDAAVERATRGPTGFSRRASIKDQARAWTAAKLTRAIDQIADAVRRGRRQADLADAIAIRALWSVALMARSKG